MTDAQKRQYVSNLYSGPKWKKRVEKMSMENVVAIYFDHLNDGEKPHHDEDSVVYEESPVLAEEGRSDRAFTHPALNDIPPRPPHENEDQFETY